MRVLHINGIQADVRYQVFPLVFSSCTVSHKLFRFLFTVGMGQEIILQHVTLDIVAVRTRCLYQGFPDSTNPHLNKVAHTEFLITLLSLWMVVFW